MLSHIYRSTLIIRPTLSNLKYFKNNFATADQNLMTVNVTSLIVTFQPHLRETRVYKFGLVTVSLPQIVMECIASSFLKVLLFVANHLNTRVQTLNKFNEYIVCNLALRVSYFCAMWSVIKKEYYVRSILASNKFLLLVYFVSLYKYNCENNLLCVT